MTTAMRSMLTAIGAIVGLASCEKASQPVEAATQQGESLGFVRLRASSGDLERLEAAAATVGWVDARREDAGTLLLKVPPNYTPESFGELLGAFEQLGIAYMGLQLLMPDGRVVRGDGTVDEK